jgi:transcriptional antiterminator RfaH
MAVVTALQGWEDAAVSYSEPPRFAPGERVPSTACSPTSVCSEGMADRERVAILLDLLGRKVRILLDEGAITAA